MLFVYIAVVGSLYEVCAEPNPIKHISVSKSECEEFAKEYAKNNLGVEINVFGWVSGERSYVSVHTKQIWSPNYNPPVGSTEVIEPEVPPPDLVA